MEAYSGQSGMRGEERSAPQKPRFLEASIYVGEAGFGNNVGLSAIYQKPSGQDAEEDMPDDPEDPMSSRTPLTDPQNTQLMNRMVTPKDSGMLTSAAAAQKELRSILAIRQQPQDERSHFKNAGTSTDLKGDDWDVLSAQTRASMTDKETITDAEFEEIGICPCLATRYWTRFFRITNSDFLKRMFYSLLFFRPSLANEIKDNPDLYGPFWIYSTLILVLASSGNLSAYFRSDEQRKFEFDFSQFLNATLFVYASGFLTPWIIGMVVRLSGSEISNLKIISLYGYAYTVYIICTFLAMIPQDTLQWVVLLYAGLTSIWHLSVCVKSEIEKVSDENVKRIKAKFQKRMNDLAVQLTPDNPNKDTVPTQTQNETNPKAKKYKLSESTTESIEDQRLKLARVSKGLITFVVISQVLICILMKALFFTKVQDYPGQKKQ